MTPPFSIGGRKLPPEARRERIEGRIAKLAERRPPTKDHDGRPTSKAEKDRAEYVIEKQLARQRQTLVNFDRRFEKPPVPEPPPRSPHRRDA